MEFIRNEANQLDYLIRTLTPEDEIQVKGILRKRWRHRHKVQNILTPAQQRQMKRILNKKWYFQRPLYDFPIEKPAKVVENFMKKQYFNVQPNLRDDLKVQEDTLNNLMTDDKEWYFDLMSGKEEVEDDDNDLNEGSALSEQQKNKLDELLEREKVANKKYIEEHPEVEGIVGMMFSNLSYYRPPDLLEFVKTLFTTCEPCLRGNVSSYLEYKKRPKTADPFAMIADSAELTDWRQVMQGQARNERTRRGEEEFKRYLDEGNDDELTKAYKKIVEKKRNEVGVDLIDGILDRIIAMEEAMEEEKMAVVAYIIELVLEELFGGCKSEDDLEVLQEKSKEICTAIMKGVMSEVFKIAEDGASVQERKSEMITNIIEMVVDQVYREVEDNEISKLLEENKANIIMQIIDSVFNTIFGEPVAKLEDRFTSTGFDVIIEAAETIMRKQFEEKRRTTLVTHEDHVVF